MSGQEDFTPLLEALVTCVGVVDLISLFGFMVNRLNAKKSSRDINNNDVSSPVRDKSSMPSAARSIPEVFVEAVEPLKLDSDVIDSLLHKVNELEAKVVELETKSREGSMERLVEFERYRRSRTPSRSPSPYPIRVEVENSKSEEESSYDDETNTSSSESRASSVRHPLKPITRDDEFRRTIKRSSQTSHESREEELMEFSQLEKQEAENMDDFVVITYEGQDNTHYRHGISPIQEVPPSYIHGEIERSPEPGMSSMVDKPWCDIKKDAAGIRKQEKQDQFRRSSSIDEQPAAEAEAIKITDKIVEENLGEGEGKESMTSEDDIKDSSIPVTVNAVDINETFIRMEQNVLQQSHPKVLVKQSHVGYDDQPEETVADLETIPLPVVEIFTVATSVKNSLTEINVAPPAVNAQLKGSTPSLSSSAADNVRGFMVDFYCAITHLFVFYDFRIMRCVQRRPNQM